MSLLSICRSVLAETGWPVLNQIAGSSDATAQQIFAIANTELEALSELFNWPQMEVEYPFTTVPGQAIQLWPADFRILAPLGVFNKSQYYGVKGSTGLQYWELLKYGKLGNLSFQKYRTVYPLGVPGIELTPTPTTAEDYVAVYYSNQYARNSLGAGVSVFTADDDEPKVPERYVKMGVKWRFRRAKGLDFSAEYAEYNATVQAQFSKYCGRGEIPVGGFRRRFPGGVTSGYVPDTGFGL